MRTQTTTLGLLVFLTALSFLSPTATAGGVISLLNPPDDVCALGHEWDENGNTTSCTAVYTDGDYVCVLDYDAASSSCETGSVRISALISEYKS